MAEIRLPGRNRPKDLEKIYRCFCEAAQNPQVEGRLYDPAAADEIRITYEDANGDAARYTTIAKQFVKASVDIIVTSGTAPALVCRDETIGGKPPIPVVFASVGILKAVD